MQPRSTSFKEPAARVGLRAICEMKPDERPGHEVLREFWDRITALAKAYTRYTKEEVEQSDSITTESIDLFHEFGPQLWRRPEPGKQRPWLYNAGEGWNGVLYENDIFFDNINDQEFLRSTTIDLIRRKIDTSVKGRKSSARPQNRSRTCSVEPPAPLIECPANASGKKCHRDAASFAKYGICWFDTKDDSIGYNGGPSFEELVVGFYDRTDGGTKTDGVEPTVFDVDVKTNPIPAECLSCITEDRAYLLQITWSRFNEGEMRKRVPTYTARLGDREVFALLRPVPYEDQGRVPSQYPLWQFWKVGGGYTESVFLAELSAREQRSIAEEMRRQQRSGPLRRVRRLTLKASAPAAGPAQPQGKKRARGPVAGGSGKDLFAECTMRNEDDDDPSEETKKRMKCSPGDEGQTAGRHGGCDGQDIANSGHDQGIGDTAARYLVPRKDDLDTFRKPTTTIPTEAQYISDQDWNQALRKAESLDATIRKSGRQVLRRYSHAGRVQETDEGTLAVVPCERCARSRNSYICRVYKDPSITGVTSCGYCASRGSSGCRAVAPDRQTAVAQEEVASPVPTSQSLGSATPRTQSGASSSRTSTLSPSLAESDLRAEPETLQLGRRQPLQAIAAVATKLEASASSHSSTTAPTLLDKAKETKQQAEQQTQAQPAQASARQEPSAEPQSDQLQSDQLQSAQGKSARAHSAHAQSAQSPTSKAQLKEVQSAQSLPAQPVQLKSAQAPAPQAQPNTAQTAQSAPAQPVQLQSSEEQAARSMPAPPAPVEATQAHATQAQSSEVQAAHSLPAQCTPPQSLPAQPTPAQPTPAQPPHPSSSAPPSEPKLRFKLWIKSPAIKGTKVVGLTNAMSVEEVIAKLQESLGRPYEGKEILSFFVDLPDEEEPFRIDKGESDDGGWEVVRDMVREGGLTKLSGVVEAGAEMEG